MKKVVLSSAIFLLAAGASTLHAETNHDWAISGQIGLVDFKSDTRPDPIFPERTHELDSDDALKAGIIASKYYKDFSFDLGIEYIEETDLIGDGRDEIATHSHIPIHLGVNYHFDTDFIDPYVGVGIGYSFNNSSPSGILAQQGAMGEDDDSIFYLFTLGFEYPINDKYSVYVSGSYKDMEIEGEMTLRGQTVKVKNNADSYEYALGVKYFF